MYVGFYIASRVATNTKNVKVKVKDDSRSTSTHRDKLKNAIKVDTTYPVSVLFNIIFSPHFRKLSHKTFQMNL